MTLVHALTCDALSAPSDLRMTPSTVRAGFLAILAACGAMWPTVGRAEHLADVFRRPAFRQLGLAPLGDAIAAAVASGYPVASASSSILYAYDPETDALERVPGVMAPLFGERAETIGRGKLSASVAYSFLEFATINGDDLDDLASRRRVNGRAIIVPVKGGVTLADGRFTTFLPAQVTTDLDVAAHQVALNLTYGLASRLDVSLTVPLLVTALDLQAVGLIPDPRFPQFALPEGRTFTVAPTGSETSTGIGDVLLRTKYLAYRGTPADVALGLGLALPSGSEGDFQGLGTTRVQPGVFVSRVMGGRFEVFLDGGIDIRTDDASRSVVRWAVGGTAEVVSTLTAMVTFLGRNELAAQGEPIRTPFFFQIERNDIYDASVGMRWRLAANAVLSANVIVPLNRDGLRPEAIPTVDAEIVF